MMPLKGPDGQVLFTETELACKGSRGLKLAPGFAEQLIKLRLRMDVPMVVNSCCRSKDYNEKVGGAASSFHIYDKPAWPTKGTCAIDIRTPNQMYKQKLHLLAWSLGWSIGDYPGFLHLDRRSDYTNQQQLYFKGK